MNMDKPTIGPEKHTLQEISCNQTAIDTESLQLPNELEIGSETFLGILENFNISSEHLKPPMSVLYIDNFQLWLS